MSLLNLSVVLPIHNEEKTLWGAVEALAPEFDFIVGPQAWQFILVENGSRDSSLQICHRIAKRWTSSQVIHLPKGDYGNALREGVLRSEGSHCLIMNVDHLWDRPYFKWAWKNRDEYDLIIGSKRADPTLNQQDQYRRVLSAGLNAILAYLFDNVAAETHGMKLIKLQSMRPVTEVCIMRRGQFDTELTLRALRGGYPIAEVPIPYMELRKPRNFMLRKIGQNVYDLFRLYQVMKNVLYDGHLRYHRFCRYDMLKQTDSEV